MGKNSASLQVEKYDVALDWATFSAPLDGEEAMHFRGFARDLMARTADRFGGRKEAKIRDYVGSRIGDTYYVTRHSDGHQLLVASGAESVRLSEEIIAHGINTVPTRLDIAATAKCGTPSPDYPNGIRENIQRIRSSQGKEQRQIMAVFEHQNGATGCTLGSRTSEVYGRIYDWEAKHCGHAKFRVWRHEIEYKGGAARRLWQSYKASPKREDVCIATLHSKMEKWGIPCSWLPDKGRLDIVGTKAPTTDEKRLEYLDKVVGPFISGLIERGRTDEVRAILEKHKLLDYFKP